MTISVWFFQGVFSITLNERFNINGGYIGMFVCKNYSFLFVFVQFLMSYFTCICSICFFFFACLWFVGWLVGWLAGWLAGWLVGWFTSSNVCLLIRSFVIKDDCKLFPILPFRHHSMDIWQKNSEMVQLSYKRCIRTCQ